MVVWVRQYGEPFFIAHKLTFFGVYLHRGSITYKHNEGIDMAKTKLLTFIAVILAVFMVNSAMAVPLNLNQILESTCRVEVDRGMGQKSMGTGNVVKQDANGDYLVLTNAHVVGAATAATLDFFIEGYLTRVNGQVIWAAHRTGFNVDMAVIRVPNSQFTKFKPRVIELAPKGYQIDQGDVIYSGGCPYGEWASGWTGRIRGFDQGAMTFWPAPVSGQSGSSVMVLVPDQTGELHTRVGLLLAWRINNGEYGGGVPLDTMYAAIEGRTTGYHKLDTSFEVINQIVEAPEHNKKWQVVPESKNDNDRTCGRCKHKKSEHVLWNGQLVCPDDTRFIRGLIPRPLNPFPQQPSPDLNKGNPPPIGGSDPEPTPPVVDPQVETLTKERDGLLAQLAELQKRYDDLKAEYEVLLAQSRNLHTQNTEMKAQLEVIINNLNITKEEKAQALAKLEGLNQQLSGLEDVINDKHKVIEEKEDKLEEKEAEVNEVKWYRNIFGSLAGLFGGSLSIWSVFSLYRKYRKGGIGAIKDEILDRVDDAKDKVIDRVEDKVKDRIDGIRDKISDKAEDKLGERGIELVDIVGGLLKSQLAPLLAELDELKNRIKGKDDNKGEPTAVNPAPVMNGELEKLVQSLTDRLAKCGEDKAEILAQIMPWIHEYYRPTPPPVLYPQKPYNYANYERPEYVRDFQTVKPATQGLGPVPPNMPARAYSAQEVLDALTELAHRHSDDPRFSVVPELVRQILEEPRRARPR